MCSGAGSDEEGYDGIRTFARWPVTQIDLTGKVALVTGGSRGIGAATAKMLAAVGAEVSITYQARQDDARKVAAAILANDGREAFILQADLSDAEACNRVVRETHRRFGRLDVFVANAAVWPSEDRSVRDMTAARWRATLATNLDSVFFGTKAALDVMADHGRIVIVSSTAGQRGEAHHADYAASKGAIISFVKSVCVETAPRAITVNAVAPGWVDTEMSALPYGRDGGEGKRAIEAGIPLGRIATAEEIAGPIVFLCSHLASGMTGEVVNVNCGSVLCG